MSSDTHVGYLEEELRKALDERDAARLERDNLPDVLRCRGWLPTNEVTALREQLARERQHSAAVEDALCELVAAATAHLHGGSPFPVTAALARARVLLPGTGEPKPGTPPAPKAT